MLMKGVSLSRTFEKSNFVFVSIDGTIIREYCRKILQSIRNSFDGSFEQWLTRSERKVDFSSSENFKARFLETTFFKIACAIKKEPLKLLL